MKSHPNTKHSNPVEKQQPCCDICAVLYFGSEQHLMQKLWSVGNRARLSASSKEQSTAKQILGKAAAYHNTSSRLQTI